MYYIVCMPNHAARCAQNGRRWPAPLRCTALHYAVPCCRSVGGAQFCLDTAREYTRSREQFGAALSRFQATQFKIADMATSIQVRAGFWGAAAGVGRLGELALPDVAGAGCAATPSQQAPQLHHYPALPLPLPLCPRRPPA